MLGRRHRPQAPPGLGAGARRRQGQGPGSRGEAPGGERRGRACRRESRRCSTPSSPGRRGRAPRRREGPSDDQRRCASAFRTSRRISSANRTRLIVLRDRRRAADTVERSVALFAVARAILSAFAAPRPNAARSTSPTRSLGRWRWWTRSSAAWVMHKLDYGLDHLLIDEAQDTSAEQWRIVAALTEEFFAGEGARRRGRTVFAVGDEKQSIFSFQGAAPEQFAEMRRLSTSATATRKGRSRPCRSISPSARRPAILAAVDKTFESGGASAGLAATDEPPPGSRGDPPRDDRAWSNSGRRSKPARPPDPDDWRMPLDEPARHDPSGVLAGRIADAIAAGFARIRASGSSTQKTAPRAGFGQATS